MVQQWLSVSPYFQSVTGFIAPVTAEVASSSLVVPASFFNNLQLGTFGIWVQLGCNRFSGFPCGQQMHRKNSLDQHFRPFYDYGTVATENRLSKCSGRLLGLCGRLP